MASGSDRPDPNSQTPAAPLTPARRMLHEFEKGRQTKRRGRWPIVAALALALVLAVAAAFALARRGKTQTKAGAPPRTATGVAPAPEDPRERLAAGLFTRAEDAAGRGQWGTVLQHLAALASRYADTRFCAEHAAAIAGLRARAEAGGEPAPHTAVAVARPDPQTAFERALATWPVAFEDALGDKACLERALLFRGQYGGHFHIHNGGLAISGVHSNSACWWNCLVGDCYAVSLDFYFAAGVPVIFLSGPGYGSHPAVGTALRLPAEGGALTIELRRQGALVGLPLRQAPFDSRAWHRLDVLRDRARIAVRLDGQMLGEWHDPEPLRGAMHAFVGLGSELGMWGDDRPHYRNLAIRMPQEDADRLAEEPVRRLFDPPVTTPPQANGEPLFLDDFAADGFGRWTAVQRADAAKVRNGKLVLQGPNAWPVVWRDEPVTGSAAIEYRMAYFPNGEAVNFNARLRLGDYPNPEKRTVFHGWQLGYPGGNGEVWLSWAARQGKGRVVAKTAYFPATHGRPYTLRFELSGRRLRVFVNGGFLLEGVAPEPVSAGAEIYPGLFQIYGGSLVERVAAWRIADLPDPGLVAGIAGEGVNFGPRLAAAGSFAAAFDAQVRPLLAERRYDRAAEVLAEVGARPEFRLAAPAVRLAETDVARLMRFWADLRPQPAPEKTAQDILAALGPNFPATDEARLRAALFLLLDRRGSPQEALPLLDACTPLADARRYRALAARALAAP